MGEDVSVPLTSFGTARPWGDMPVMAMVQAGKGMVLVAGRYLLNATGIPLRISGEPLVHPEWLKDTAVFLQNLAGYIVGIMNETSTWTTAKLRPSTSVGPVGSADFDLDRSPVLDHLPGGVHVDTFAAPDAHLTIPPAENYYMGYGFEDECYFTALTG